MKVQPFIVDPISVGYLIGPKGFKELQIVDYWEAARAAGAASRSCPGSWPTVLASVYFGAEGADENSGLSPSTRVE
jgi:hypothetical protein